MRRNHQTFMKGTLKEAMHHYIYCADTFSNIPSSLNKKSDHQDDTFRSRETKANIMLIH